MPALFLGHGNPMLTLEDNLYTQGWQQLGNDLPKPRAILAISAHWYAPTRRVSTTAHPATIHDFYGFPEQLFQVEYPASGSPELAERVLALLGEDGFEPDAQRGLDHGAWSVLRHLYPDAEIPVIQLSIDQRMSPAEHFRLGQKLAPLRDEQILVLTSGNLVHNLMAYNWQNPQVAPPEWAVAFENWNREQLVSGTPERLVEYLGSSKMAAWSAPTPDHYLPLLYLAALQRPDDHVTFALEGFDGGSMSMLSVILD
ncbi:MAG: 4,5-DOPA dioxygenase extradiol [Desulfuromonas sp.]|nr:MAG: 4,5-DOPA dioxygenase extradiol [Desulfuromonas sp.]